MLSPPMGKAFKDFSLTENSPMEERQMDSLESKNLAFSQLFDRRSERRRLIYVAMQPLWNALLRALQTNNFTLVTELAQQLWSECQRLMEICSDRILSSFREVLSINTPSKFPDERSRCRQMVFGYLQPRWNSLVRALQVNDVASMAELAQELQLEFQNLSEFRH
jgi:hypothetical protein